MGKINAYKHWKRMLLNISMMLTGILMALFWPNLWNHILLKQWELKPGKLIYKFWSVQPLMHLDVYFFNWTNHEEFTNHSVKPKFEEVGPYRFQQHVRKVNITFHENNSTVSYKKQTRYNFVPEQSRGQLTDVITTPNVIALSASNQAKSFNIFKIKGIEMSLAFFGHEIHVTKNASELLFEGYEDSMMGVMSEIGKVMGYTVPFDDRFGWFYKKNESTDVVGRYTVDTSTSNIDQLRYWTGISKPKFLETNCSSYKGSSGGELFPPDLIKNNQKVSIYTEEMCRSLDLDFEEDTDVNGIAGKKFISGDRTIDNGTKYPENECYCNGECVPSGVLNITACRLGAPAFVSYPHFYLGDQYYQDQLEGMKPEKEKHEFFVILEPTTSLILKASARVQLNILVKPIPKIKMYRNVPTKFLPVVWIEQSFKIDNQMTFMIKLMLWIPFIGQMVGFIIAIISIYIIFRFAGVEEKERNCLNEKDKYETKEPIKARQPELSPLVNGNNNNFPK